MPIIPDILRWAKLAVKQKQNNMAGVLFSLLSLIGMSAPTSMKDSLPQLMNLMLDSGRTGEMFGKLLYCNSKFSSHFLKKKFKQ